MSDLRLNVNYTARAVRWMIPQKSGLVWLGVVCFARLNEVRALRLQSRIPNQARTETGTTVIAKLVVVNAEPK